MALVLLSNGIYSGFIGTVSTATIKAVSTITSLSYLENPDVKKLLDELDIKCKLSIIKSVLEKFESHTAKKLVEFEINSMEKSQIFEIINSDIDLNKDPIKLCLIHLSTTINELEKTLNKIRVKIQNHNNKWFSTWRYLKIDSLLDELKTYSNQLNTRFDNLVKVSDFIKSLEK